ncbi:far upstream element-binding protein 2-like [Procambarus clarkii]|uniref:far upstream element-binding protein 2-like n=1 Tax=Procambarus clarkii TaxID=6728 RepID=UPI0037439E3F
MWRLAATLHVVPSVPSFDQSMLTNGKLGGVSDGEEFTAKPISTRGSSQDGATAPETHKTEKEEESKPDLTTVISGEDEETLGGRTIQELERRFSVTIYLSQKTEELMVTGDDASKVDGCRQALVKLMTAASNEGKRATAAKYSHQVQVICPGHTHGFIIGREGKTIKELQERFSVRIELLPKLEEVSVKGSSASTVGACLDILGNLMESAPPVTPVNYSHRRKLPCPLDMHGVVIGHAGKTVRELESRHSVKIVLLRETEEVRVMGNTRDSVAACFSAIKTLIKPVPPPPLVVKRQ